MSVIVKTSLGTAWIVNNGPWVSYHGSLQLMFTSAEQLGETMLVPYFPDPEVQRARNALAGLGVTGQVIRSEPAAESIADRVY